MQAYYTQNGEVLDQICQKIYGTTAQITELVLANNPKLSDLPTHYPPNTMILLPEIGKKNASVRATVNLWD